jgi:nucleoside-diphosphate-sugar epimerase
MRKTALVTGGSGFVGARLIEMLLADGWTVRAMGRSTQALDKIAQLGATAVRADLGDRTSLGEAVQDCAVVFHSAAFFRLWGEDKQFTAANVDGTARLLSACESAGTVERFIQIGAAAVVMGKPRPLLKANESLPLQSPSWAPYISSKSRSEALVLGANGKAGMLTSVIRPPLIWGRGMPMLEDMKKSVAAGHFRWPGDGSQLMSTCHVDNVCHAAMLAAKSTQGGLAYFVSDGEDRTLRQVVTDLLATQHTPAPTATTAFSVAWIMARLMELAWRGLSLKGEPPITRQMLRMIGMPFTLDIDRAGRELAYRPIVTWREGIDSMLTVSQGFPAAVSRKPEGFPGGAYSIDSSRPPA